MDSTRNPNPKVTLLVAADKDIARLEAKFPNVIIERENPTFEFPAEVLQEAKEIAREEG